MTSEPVLLPAPKSRWRYGRQCCKQAAFPLTNPSRSSDPTSATVRCKILQSMHSLNTAEMQAWPVAGRQGKVVDQKQIGAVLVPLAVRAATEVEVQTSSLLHRVVNSAHTGSSKLIMLVPELMLMSASAMKSQQHCSASLCHPLVQRMPVQIVALKPRLVQVNTLVGIVRIQSAAPIFLTCVKSA